MSPTNSDHQRPMTNRIFVLLPPAGILIFGGAMISWLARHEQTTALNLLDSLTRSLYLPSMNCIKSRLIGGLPFNSYVYILWALMAVTIFIPAKLLSRKKPSSPGLSPLLVSISLWLFITTTGLQTINQVRTHLIDEARLLEGKTTEEKISLNFPKTYAFARYCQRLRPGPCLGKAITDLSLEVPAQLLTTTAAKYYLYPIDIRTRQDRTEDCLVIFAKQDPLNSIEPGFVPLPPFDETSLIAVRP